MPSKKPFSWERNFHPERDGPPREQRRQLVEGTAMSLSRRYVPMPPMGDFVFRQTREIALNGPIQFASGRAHDEWVYYVKNGKQFVRAFVTPRDPKSSFQLDQRVRMKQVQMGWQELTREQWEAWDEFAATIPHLAGDTGKRKTLAGHRCHRLYQSAQLNRLAMGLPLADNAPTRRVRVRVTAVEVVAAPVASQIALRVFHLGQTVPGLRVLVEMTPAMTSAARMPRENELTKAGAIDLQSYFELGESGATYLLEQPRYQITPGDRFGIRVTVVSEEGLRSRSEFHKGAIGLPPGDTMPSVNQRFVTPSRNEPSSATGAGGEPQSTPDGPRVLSHDDIHREHKIMFDAIRNRVYENPNYKSDTG